MYAAISGLDANQSMLNDTASDLANVNTIGYKASSITFADALTQVIPRSLGPDVDERWLQPRSDRLGRAGERHPQRNDGGLLPVNQQPARHRDRGQRLPARRSGHAPAKAPYTTGLPSNVQYSRAGDLTTNTQGFLTPRLVNT